jgi:small subunit ribosomal protein S4
MNSETFKATVVNRLPTRDEMEQNINEQLIVEFYSRF